MKDSTKLREVFFILFGLLAILLCIPRLLARDDESSGYENSRFMDVIETDLFKFTVMSTLGMSVPLTFEIITELGFSAFKWSPFLEWEKNTSSRLILWIAMVVPPLLYIHFAFIEKQLIATQTIQHIRTILNVLIFAIQFNCRTEKIHSLVLVGTCFLSYIIGAVLKVYTSSFSQDDPILFASLICRLVSVVVFCIAVAKHCWMYCKGELKEDQENLWQTATIQLTLFIPAFWLLIIREKYKVESIYEQNDVLFTGYNILISVVVSLLNAVLSTETKFSQAVMTEKLAMKRLFVRFISHEVRTPLNSCILGLEYMKKRFESSNSPTNAESVDLLQEIAGSCKTAVEFMDNLLLYEKVDSLQLPLFPKAEDLIPIFADIHSSFLLSAQELGVKMAFRVDNRFKWDRGEGSLAALASIDKSKIGVVFRNLISNALKFTPRGGMILCSVTTVTSDLPRKDARVVYTEAPTHIRITVSDNGPGMTPEECTSLFKAFVQFSPNELQQGGGSGIGLYLCHKIIQQHGLAIQVKSAKGAGSAFFIDFPIISEILRSDSIAAASIKEIISNAAAQSVDDIENDMVQPYSKIIETEKLAILIVDDSPLMRKMLRRTLLQHQFGCQIDEANDGIELLERIGFSFEDGVDSLTPPSHLKRYDIIIVDNHMPRMAGPKSIRILRSHGYDGIIVGHTGDASVEDLESFCHAGADIALPKPFDVEAFKAFVIPRLSNDNKQ